MVDQNALLTPPGGFLKEGDFLAPNEHPASRHRPPSELGRRCRTDAERDEVGDREHQQGPAECHGHPRTERVPVTDR